MEDRHDAIAGLALGTADADKPAGWVGLEDVFALRSPNRRPLAARRDGERTNRPGARVLERGSDFQDLSRRQPALARVVVLRELREALFEVATPDPAPLREPHRRAPRGQLSVDRGLLHAIV